MTIHELLAKFTADQIGVQFLNSCVTHVNNRKAKLTEISFLTNAVNTDIFLRDSGRAGVVLWLDREVYTQVLEEIKKNQETRKESPCSCSPENKTNRSSSEESPSPFSP